MPYTISNNIESLNHFEAFFECGNIGILVTDDKEQIISINPFALKQFGYSEAELIGKKVEKLIPRRFNDKYKNQVGKYFVRTQPHQIGIQTNLFGLRNDGSKFPVELSLCHYTSDGIKYTVAFITYISDLKATEVEIGKLNIGLENTTTNQSKDLQQESIHHFEKLNRLENVLTFQKSLLDAAGAIKVEKELKKVRQLFLQLLHNYPDGMISIIDKNYNFVYTGGELHKRLHSNIEQLTGKEMFPRFQKPLRKIIFEILANVFKDKTFISGFELPYSIEGRTYMMDAFPLMEVDGSLNNICVIIKNISKLKKEEEGLRELLKIERNSGELKTRFVSMASHEFRTPLSTVLSSAYLIEKYTTDEDQPKREKHLQRIVSSVNMLTDILNDFLSLGKMEEGKLQAKFSIFNIEEIIKETLDEIKNNLKKGQQINYWHQGNPNVFLDNSMLKHIVMNLVSNASKFSSDSSSIDIKTTCQNKQIILSVKDNGIGISKEDQQHLMERFFRGTNAGNIHGTGLGLHIISKYAEMMGGKIECKSQLEMGSEFIVTFNTKESL